MADPASKWSVHADEASGYAYYVNNETGTPQWEKPEDYDALANWEAQRRPSGLDHSAAAAAASAYEAQQSAYSQEQHDGAEQQQQPLDVSGGRIAGLAFTGITPVGSLHDLQPGQPSPHGSGSGSPAAAEGLQLKMTHSLYGLFNDAGEDGEGGGGGNADGDSDDDYGEEAVTYM
jgi:hypothetical protein